MIQRDYLIVGGGVGGASVCDSLRRYDAKGSVTLVSNEPYLPYQRPPLSKSFLQDASVNFDKVIKKRRIGTRKEVSKFDSEPTYVSSTSNGALLSWKMVKRSSFARHAWPPVAEPDDPRSRVPTSAT